VFKVLYALTIFSPLVSEKLLALLQKHPLTRTGGGGMKKCIAFSDITKHATDKAI
jgi:hypothetical protein